MDEANMRSLWREAALECLNDACRRRYPLTEKLFACPACDDVLSIAYEPTGEAPDAVRARWRERRLSNDPLDQSGVWRFRECLPPIPLQHVVTLREGNTPIYRARFSAQYAGVRNLLFKHLGFNPTGSFKDYGMTVAVSQARALGARVLVCASTGNTSASMAAYAARAGMRAVVLIPSENVALGKVAQALEYGAVTLRVKGANFDDVLRLVRQLSARPDVYLLNSLNPFRIEGQKAIFIELLDQLGWEVPEHLVVPGGNLGNSAALFKAIEELRRLGLIARWPKLTIVQAQGASPLATAVAQGAKRITPVPQPRTHATAIRIGHPVNWRRALHALETTGGFCVAVSEEEIAEAKAAIGREGLGCEPASAATLAGIKKLREEGKLAPSETIVALLTGHLLKDPEYTMRYHSGQLDDALTGRPLRARLANPPICVEPHLDALIRCLYDEESSS
ncbi:MAG: threonine synthase [Blastocatellia bacterium]|nr:threonine synthase [Blastocatellia bacterium]